MSPARGNMGEQSAAEEQGSQGDRLRQFLAARATAIVFVLLLGALFGLTCAIGVPPTITCGHDLFAALDAGWRVMAGQRPHVDFYCPYGAAVPLLVGLGMRLSGGAVAGVAVANAILGLLASVMAYRICRRTVHAVAAVVLALFTFMVAAAPSLLGSDLPTSAMFYTRWASALLIVILLECLAPEESNRESAWYAGGALSLLFFVKLNMFLLGAGLIAGSLLLTFRRQRAQALLSGAGVVLLAALVYLRFHVGAVCHDYSIILHVKSHGTSMNEILQMATALLTWFVLLLVMTGLSALRPHSLLRRLYLPLLALGTFGCEVMSCITNAPFVPRVTLLVFALLFCAARLAGGGQDRLYLGGQEHLRPVASLLLLIVASVAFLYARATEPAVYCQTSSLTWGRKPEPPAIFDAPMLASYHVFGGPQSDNRPVDGEFLAAKVNDGLELLKELSPTSESVAALDFANPFSYGQRRPPAHGGTLFLQEGINFNDQFKPSPEGVFGDASVVMVPFCEANFCSNGSAQLEAILRNYGPYLREHYILAGESQQWQLWRKRELGR